MKKEYIKPHMEVVILKNNQQLLAGSATVSGLDGFSSNPATDYTGDSDEYAD